MRTAGAEIRVLTKGHGDPLLLLHGHPEIHVMAPKIAGSLALRFSVVLMDLRGLK